MKVVVDLHAICSMVILDDGGGRGGIRRLKVVNDELGKPVGGRGRGLRDGDVAGVCVMDVVPAETFVRDLLGRSGSRGGIGGLFGGKHLYARLEL